MTRNAISPELAKLADEVCFLTAHAQCPERQRKLLQRWVVQVRCGRKEPYREEALFDVVNALVTLSHMNAGFSRSMAPPFYQGKPELDVEDRGGYFAGRQAITMLIRTVPIKMELRLSLVQSVLKRIDRDMHRLENLVPMR